MRSSRSRARASSTHRPRLLSDLRLPVLRGCASKTNPPTVTGRPSSALARALVHATFTSQSRASQLVAVTLCGATSRTTSSSRPWQRRATSAAAASERLSNRCSSVSEKRRRSTTLSTRAASRVARFGPSPGSLDAGVAVRSASVSCSVRAHHTPPAASAARVALARPLASLAQSLFSPTPILSGNVRPEARTAARRLWASDSARSNEPPTAFVSSI